MRNGYPARRTLGEQLEARWFGKPDHPFFPHWKRVSDVLVDGVRLYDTHPLLRTPSIYETRHSQKFSEVMLAAHALVRLDCARIEIDTGGATPYERPDLRAVLDGCRIAIEVGEVHPYAAGTNAALDLQIEMNEMIDADRALWPEYTYLHITRSPGRGGPSALPPKMRRRLLTVLSNMLRDGSYREWVGDSIRTVFDWPGASLGYTLYVVRCPSQRGYLKFDDSACSFNPEGLIAPALRMLERKRKLGVQYDRSLPLWLVLGLTEEQGVYGKSLEALAKRAADISPYERVIAHDGMTFATYARDTAA